MFESIFTKRNFGIGGIIISMILAVFALILITKLLLVKVPIATFVDSSIQEFPHDLLTKEVATTIKLNDVSAILIAKKDGSVQLLTSSKIITHSEQYSMEELLQLASDSTDAYANHMHCIASQREYCFTGMYNGRYYSNVCWCE
ncbi:MAG: hypothetical protein KBA82_09725 [Nitrosomonas sp.]|nr:hypothetical protein [Nitrosomonas sp.]MBP7113230.1 hypothetical protein [Nitrosomonas sp.]